MSGHPLRYKLNNWQTVALALILPAAFALRIWGIDFGLPNTAVRPDETTLVHRALAMGSGDLNPHFFRYPSLHFYVLALVYGMYYLAGTVTGRFDGTADFQYEYFTDPSTIFIIGRALTAAMGTATVALVYSMATRWRDRTAGVLSAAFLGVAFLHVRDSHFLTLDVPATFYLLVACAFAWRQFDHPSNKTALLCGLFVGLAASTKYNTALLAPTVLVAVWLAAPGGTGSRERWTPVAMTALAALGGFIAGSPYVLLDFSAFISDVTAEGGQFSLGRDVDLGIGWTYHLHTSLPTGLGWPLLAASAAGLVLMALRRSHRDMALLSGLLSYYLVAGSGRSVYLRYVIPMVPLLCLAAGVCIAAVTARIKGSAQPYVLLGVGLLIAAPAALSSLHHDRLLAAPDTRQLAARWITQHVPPGATLGLAGSRFGHPRLNRSRMWLEHAREDQRNSGHSAQRLSLMLSLKDYPLEPSYYIYELSPANPRSMRTVLTEWSAANLKNAGIEWVVTQQHPLVFSQLPRSLGQLLKQNAELVATFDPFTDATTRPPFDPIDAFYTPVSDFAAARYNGPIIEIYHINGT